MNRGKPMVSLRNLLSFRLAHHVRTTTTLRGEEMTTRLLTLLWACGTALAAPVLAQQKPAAGPDVRIPSTVPNVIRGHIPADLPPIMRVKPGQLVTIDTLSHQGLNTG